MSNSAAELRRKLGLPGNLLTPPTSNPKLAKGEKYNYETWGLSLAPANVSGHEVCPMRSPGCTAACLYSAGNPVYAAAKKKGRIAKTKALFADRDTFMNLLALEIHAANVKSTAAKANAAFRLNVLSDILWEVKKFTLLPWVAEKISRGVGGEKITIINLFKDLRMYDYTKVPGRKPPANYSLTFSESEINAVNVQKEMARGMNIASVFPRKAVPQYHLGRKVIDGDETDLRFLDPQGVIVGLKVKGQLGLADRSGFTHHTQEAQHA